MTKETLKRSKSSALRSDLPPEHDISNQIEKNHLNNDSLNVSPPKKMKIIRKRKRDVATVKNENIIDENMNVAPNNEGEVNEVFNNNNDGSPNMDVNGEVDLPYDEYYPTTRYAIDSNNNDRYAKKRNLDEFYRMNADGVEEYAIQRPHDGPEFPFYARSRRNLPIVAMSSDGKPIYPPTDNSEHLFPKHGNKQVYITLANGQQIYPEYEKNYQEYAKDENGNQYCALDEQQNEYYATTPNDQGHIIEYVPISKDGSKTPIKLLDGTKKYPVNKSTGFPVYETNHNGDEIYWKDEQGNDYYGKNYVLNRDVYSKNKAQDEEQVAKFHDGTPFYAIKQNGKQIYPVKVGKGQYYIKIGDREILAQDEQGYPYYAKDVEQNEYYPKIFS